jgi:hypothetical protein
MFSEHTFDLSHSLKSYGAVTCSFLPLIDIFWGTKAQTDSNLSIFSTYYENLVKNFSVIYIFSILIFSKLQVKKLIAQLE